MNKALFYLSLARKAGKVELGEEPAGAAALARKARLMAVACDASDHTWRRAQSSVSGTQQLCIRLPFSKEEMGQAVGRTSLALAAFTDPALALQFVLALPEPEKYADAAESLKRRTERIRRHREAEKAQKRSVRRGTKK